MRIGDTRKIERLIIIYCAIVLCLTVFGLGYEYGRSLGENIEISSENMEP